jgi:AraC-like DNA-binding protein
MRKKGNSTSTKTGSLPHFSARILSVGEIALAPHQWEVPKSTSLFWSIYIPNRDGLVLGHGKGAAEIAAGSIGLVAYGSSAARDNTADINATFLHFDVGGYAGIVLGRQLSKIAVIPAKKFQPQAAALNEAIGSGNALLLQLRSQELLAGVLAESLAEGKKVLNAPADVEKILVVLHAIEERLNASVYQPLKISEMAEMCALKPVHFSRLFFETIGKNPAEYAQSRRTAIAVQQLLFTDKSIDAISSDLSFANRFYFSRVFKDEVGDTPAAYRAVFRG